MANKNYIAKGFEGSGVYSNKSIKRAIKAGHIICHPYIKENVNGSSIDLTLGENFYTIADKRNLPYVYNPFDEEHVKQKFEGPHKPRPHEEMCRKLGLLMLNNVPADHPVIVVHPKERILAHTHEFVGINAPGTSSMHSRSTIGRNGVVTCHDAGWGDPGYINRWTMEIQNIDEHQAIVVPIGERIAQLVFHYTLNVKKEYSSLSGKYQTLGSKKIKKIIKSWEPSAMLPKAYKDERKLPKKL